MSSKRRRLGVKSPLSDRRKRGDMFEVVQYVLYFLNLLLAATIIFLQLAMVIPRWRKIIPFYRVSTHAIESIFALNKVEVIPKSDGNKWMQLKIGFVQKGDRGFFELLEIIQRRRKIEK